MKFQFSVRDILWLVLLVAVLMGWGIDHSRLYLRQHKLNQNVESLRPFAEGNPTVHKVLFDHSCGELLIVTKDQVRK